MQNFRLLAVERLARASGLDASQVDALLQEAQADRGDFALPCFTLAKELRKAPPAIAAGIVEAFEPGDGIGAKAEGPYVNVTVDRDLLARTTLAAVAVEGDAWGGSAAGEGLPDHAPIETVQLSRAPEAQVGEGRGEGRVLQARRHRWTRGG